MSESEDYTPAYQTTAIILVTGAFRAGKSSFIMSISELDYIVSDTYYKIHPAHVTELGRVSIENELALYFIESPSIEADADLYFRKVSLDGGFFKQNFIGTIHILNSWQPETFSESTKILKLVQIHTPKPYVIVANFSNIPDAFSPDDLRLILNVPPEIPIVPCIATNKESVKRVLLTLLDEVLKRLAADDK